MWGFWDGRHWRNDAPLFYEDWSKKPAYEAYTDLVFDEWWTEKSGETDADGHYTTRGFEGTYEITAEADGLVGREMVTVGDDTGSVTVELAPGSVAGIDLDVPQQVLEGDETTTIGVTLTDTNGAELSVSNDDLRFESDSPDVVAVSEEGVVSAAGTGAATVTVTATAEGDTAVGSVRFFANQEATSADTVPTGPGVVVDGLVQETTYEIPHAVGVSVTDDDSAVTGQSVTLDGDAWAGGEVLARGRHVLGVEATSEAGVTTTTEVDFAVENADNSLFARIDPSTTDATVGQRVKFGVEDTTDGDTWIDSLEWTFGDGTSATGWWNAHRFDSAGTYTVRLTATDNLGYSTTHDVEIIVG